MYGDSHALSSIFPPNFKHKEEQQQMESDYCNNGSYGLLRFRSAPTSLLESFTEKTGKLGFSRFYPDEMNEAEAEAENGDVDDGHASDNNNKGSGSRFANSQLPPQYPRQSGAQLGYRGVALNQGLMRQNSSPAGFFSQNGNFFMCLYISFVRDCCLLLGQKQ